MKIMFCGKKRAGKDVCCDYLKAWYGGESHSFAEPLYRIMYAYQDAIGVDRFKDRDFLKMIGDYGRKTNPDIWINICLSAFTNPKSNAYISDGRFANEADAGLAKAFVVVHVVADDDVRAARLDPDDSIHDDHASENGFPDDYPFQFTITNNGTLAELHSQLNALVQIVMAGGFNRQLLIHIRYQNNQLKRYTMTSNTDTASTVSNTTTMKLMVLNGGLQRASYSVAFEGHLNAEAGPVCISKRSIEVLKQLSDLGMQFGAGDKLEATLNGRLQGFPGGPEVIFYLAESGMSVFDYIANASKALAAAEKSAGGTSTGSRAKRGDGHNTKATKFLNQVVSKLICRMAPASTDGNVSDAMLIAGYDAALVALAGINKDEVVALARKVAEKSGLDLDGRVRLRGEGSKSGSEANDSEDAEQVKTNKQNNCIRHTMTIILPQLDNNLSITFAIDVEGECNIFYNGIKVMYIDVCGTVGAQHLNADDVEELQKLNIELNRKNNTIVFSLQRDRMPVKLVETRDGIQVKVINTDLILNHNPFANIKTAEVFCAVRKLFILQERIKLQGYT